MSRVWRLTVEAYGPYVADVLYVWLPRIHTGKCCLSCLSIGALSMCRSVCCLVLVAVGGSAWGQLPPVVQVEPSPLWRAEMADRAGGYGNYSFPWREQAQMSAMQQAQMAAQFQALERLYLQSKDAIEVLQRQNANSEREIEKLKKQLALSEEKRQEAEERGQKALGVANALLNGIAGNADLIHEMIDRIAVKMKLQHTYRLEKSPLPPPAQP